MKFQKPIRIVTLTVFLLTAGTFISAQTSNDLNVSDARWVYDVNRNFNFHSANSTSSKLSPFNAPVLQEVSALFHNQGNKTVKKVGWEFVVYEDALKTKIKRIYISHDKTDILPGESVRLNKVGLLYDSSQYQEAKVVSIEYADGTSWKGKKTKK